MSATHAGDQEKLKAAFVKALPYPKHISRTHTQSGLLHALCPQFEQTSCPRRLDRNAPPQWEQKSWEERSRWVEAGAAGSAVTCSGVGGLVCESVAAGAAAGVSPRRPVNIGCIGLVGRNL